MSEATGSRPTASDPSAAPGVAVRFSAATVEYPNGVRGLDALDLDILDRDLVIVVGLSGAGKSTMLRSINRLVPLSDGQIDVGGMGVRGAQGQALRELRSRVGMIFQDHRLVKRLTVLDNVLLGRLARIPTWRSVLGLWPKEDVEIAMDALDRVGIADRALTRASNLSGGQQQRVGIARALAQQPRIILADEPVASLDPLTSHQVMQDLVRINGELGITTLINLHFLDLAKEYGQRIIGLHAGKLVHDGPASSVTDDDFRRIYERDPTADDLLEAG